jgi:hypothetical protein
MKILLALGLALGYSSSAACAPLTSSALQADIELIARPRSAQNPETLRQIGDYIAREFAAAGFSLERQILTEDDHRYENIVAIKKGADLADNSALLVIAHFDSVPNSPGADDNASGVAALLEVARLAAKMRFSKTLKLVALNLEESNGLGAARYIQQARSTHENISGVINLEMLGYRNKKAGSQKLPEALRGAGPMLRQYASSLGYPEEGMAIEEFLRQPEMSIAGDFLAVVANERSLGLLRQFIQGAKSTQGGSSMLPIIAIQDGRIMPDTRRGDHAAFWDAGYPALMITDTADLRNPNYHSPEDTAQTLDLEFLNENIRAIFSAIVSLLGPAAP